MRRINNIVISSTPPSTQDLWITDDNQLKFFGPNGWTSVVFKVDNTDIDSANSDTEYQDSVIETPFESLSTITEEDSVAGEDTDIENI